MALTDRPQVDQSAIKSAESVRELNKWLNKDTGFILRSEDDDMGCDFMAELLINKGATNLKFPIQLKSITRTNFIENGNFISYALKTSRLGYMLNHLPTTGIFVFYDIGSKLLYYDFSDSILSRIKESRETDDWMENDTVSIHIPVTNLITITSVEKLHTQLAELFLRATKMQAAHGHTYQLPVIDVGNNIGFDPNNKEHLKKMLKRLGIVLLTRYDLAPVYDAIIKFSNAEIEEDKDLLLLASVVYEESGRFYESDLFIRKLKRKYTLTEGEKQMLEFADAKNKLRIGKLTNNEFADILEKLKAKPGNDMNMLTIRINLLRLRSMELDGLSCSPPEMSTELDSIYALIETCDTDEESKTIFKLWNTEQESNLLTHQLSYDLLTIQLAKSSGNQLPLEKRGDMMKRFISREADMYNRIESIYKDAVGNKNLYISATSLSMMVTHLIQKLLILISHNDITTTISENKLQSFSSFAFNAYQQFAQIGMLKDAHFSLCNAMELLHTASHYYKSPVEKDMEVLMEEKLKLENELLLEPYELLIPGLINIISRNEEDDESRNSLVNLNDTQLENIAKLMFSTLQLPHDRFPYFMSEMRDLRTFQQRCTDKNIDIRVMNYLGTSKAYEAKVSYILINKATGIQTISSKDIDHLLSAWGF